MTNHPLKSYRDNHGLSQAALGERIGVDRITVWRWENGKRQPSPAQCKLLTEATGIPARKLRPDLADLLERA